MKRRLSVTNLSLENNLPTFRLNAPVVIRADVNWSIQSKCQQDIFRKLKLVTDSLLLQGDFMTDLLLQNQASKHSDKYDDLFSAVSWASGRVRPQRHASDSRSN